MARYRMRQVVELTGMSRQAIHFYIKKGLVPPPIKHGQTSAEYTDEHVQRIVEVRRLRDEQFLPLDAIRASLDERDEGFSPAQRRVISGVRGQFSSRKRPRGKQATISVAAAARRTGVAREEIEGLIEAGLVEGAEDARGGLRIGRDELWLIELWAELSSLGFGSEQGFSPADVGLYQRHLDTLVRDEVAMVVDRLGQQPPEQLSLQIERVLPIIGALIGQIHDRAIRKFLAAMSSE